jgi:hypothetical protein
MRSTPDLLFDARARKIPSGAPLNLIFYRHIGKSTYKNIQAESLILD